MKKILFIVFIFVLLSANTAFAKIGVGVGTGKIVVDEKLKPGVIYNLPRLTVMNTGDVEAEYSVGIAYHEKQPEKRPEKGWFLFSPKTFKLKPNEIKSVEMKLNLPVVTDPGKYFAYVEAFPIQESKDGASSVGIAAATKLYFEIEPANIFLGIFYKIRSFWNIYAPWPQIFTGGFFLVLILILFKKHFHIELSRKKESNSHQDKGL